MTAAQIQREMNELEDLMGITKGREREMLNDVWAEMLPKLRKAERAEARAEAARVASISMKSMSRVVRAAA